MRHFPKYLAGCVVICCLILFYSCEPIVIGGLSGGQAVQLHLKLVEAAQNDTLSLDQVSISFKKAQIGDGTGSSHEFAVTDTMLVLFPEDPDRFVTEKVVTAGSYDDLDVIFGMPSDTTTQTSDNTSLSVKGFFLGKPFEFNVSEDIALDLIMTPTLQVQQNNDSLKVLNLLLDYPSWFKDDASGAWLDPSDESNSDRIIANISSAAAVNIESGEDTQSGVEVRPVIGVAGDVTAGESDGTMAFGVSLDRASDNTVTVNYETSDNSATSGEDYVSTDGTLEFLPGEMDKDVSVTLVDDSIKENEERFTFKLSQPENGDIDVQKRKASGFITDDDTTQTDGGDETEPVLAIEGDVSANEGAGTVSFTVNLSAAQDSTVKVDYSTSDKSAKAESDYESASGTLTFDPGVVEKTVEVTLLDDTDTEPDEKFNLTLTNPVGASLDSQKSTATATILDNDS